MKKIAKFTVSSCIILIMCAALLISCEKNAEETKINEEIKYTAGLGFATLSDGTLGVNKGSTQLVDNIVIPPFYKGKKVAKILPNAFDNSIHTLTIVIPDTVTEIGCYAFRNCDFLKQITIPEGVTVIEDEAFYYCSRLANIDLPETLISMGNGVFAECVSLENVKIPEGVTAIGDKMFYNCHKLESVSLPDGITRIGISAFSNCESLKSIKIPNTVTSIDLEAFYNCTSLINIVYDGTKDQWNKIEKGRSWDNNTGNYTVYCVDGNIIKN